MSKIVLIAITLVFISVSVATAQIEQDILTYPNPFYSELTIEFTIDKGDTVSLGIYDSSGKTIKAFFDKSFLSAGLYKVNFKEDSLPGGIYQVILVKGNIVKISKVVKVGIINLVDTVSQFNTNFTVFPNPASEQLTIPIEGQKTIRIFAMNGRICRVIETPETTISLSDLAVGNYFVTSTGSDNQLVGTAIIEKGK